MYLVVHSRDNVISMDLRDSVDIGAARDSVFGGTLDPL